MNTRTSRSSVGSKPRTQPAHTHMHSPAVRGPRAPVIFGYNQLAGFAATIRDKVFAAIPRGGLVDYWVEDSSVLADVFESQSIREHFVFQPTFDPRSCLVPSAVTHYQPKPSPAPFSREWHGALGRFLVKVNSAELNSAVVQLMQTFGQLAPLRPPHIELIDDEEICFTWNKHNKYLDVTAFKDGHLEWYFRDSTDESKPSTQGEGPTLSDDAIKLIEQYARP